MKKFSILIPSRGRPKECLNAIQSFKALAANPEMIQFIVRIDDDDPAQPDYLSMIQHYGVAILIGKRFRGYVDNNLMIEEAASKANGDLLMQCVDTAEMLTPEWDRIYEETIQGNPIAVVASHVLDGNDNPVFPWSFPLITRRLYELTEEFCLGQNPSVDRCWEAFAEEMDCGIIAPVRISHIERRGSVLQDKTAEESLKFYDDLNRDWGKRCFEFKAIAQRMARKVREQLA